MIFHRAPIPGPALVEPEWRGDARGGFARLFCAGEFAAAGLGAQIAQVNMSRNAQAGTLRGLHYQLPPAAETKLVRCLRGAVWDVVVDLRPDSPGFRRWFGAALTPANGLMMQVPQGFAHGFITLAEDTELLYLMGAPYTPAQERGVRWDDPAIGIAWPRPPAELSPKDRAWPDLAPDFHGLDRLRGLAA